MQTRNMNANMNPKPKSEHDCRKTSVSQQNIMTRHNMSHTCHMRHIIMPDDQTTKNNFAHVDRIPVKKNLV